jgi:ATP-binding protein involved in chromosome partitioning
LALTRENVIETLKSLKGAKGLDIISGGEMHALEVTNTSVRFVLEIEESLADFYSNVKELAESKLKKMGAQEVSIALTAHTARKAPPDLTGKQKPKPKAPQEIPGVDRVLAVASGKGGVGKSTVSANLACALANQGRKVGLLDADVYGPSQPRMLGVSGRPSSPDGKTIIPLKNHGVTMMSMGLMTEDGQAIVWRGPMLMSALQQMMMQVQWGDLDVLIVDLPPGTGDVQMTLAQKTSVSGAIIVSTPQDVALIDARKGIDMFNQLNVPIHGMIENMSTHICPNCGHEEHVFGHGGVKKEASKIGVPLLAEIPLHLDIRIASDRGVPIVVSAPTSPQAMVFSELAKSMIVQGQA